MSAGHSSLGLAARSLLSVIALFLPGSARRGPPARAPSPGLPARVWPMGLAGQRAARGDCLPGFVRLGSLGGVCPPDLASLRGWPAKLPSPAPTAGRLPARACAVKSCLPGRARQGSPVGRSSWERARSGRLPAQVCLRRGSARRRQLRLLGLPQSAQPAKARSRARARRVLPPQGFRRGLSAALCLAGSRCQGLPASRFCPRTVLPRGPGHARACQLGLARGDLPAKDCLQGSSHGRASALEHMTRERRA